MYTMKYDIKIGEYTLGMLDKVEIHKSVELLADTATITLPAAQYNVALDIEKKIERGLGVVIRLGYEETGLVTEFEGWVQRIATDGGNITIYCEDDLFMLRKAIPNKTWGKVSLDTILKYIIDHCQYPLQLDNKYTWSYSKFVINNATGYDVLKKIQEECGADIYIKDVYKKENNAMVYKGMFLRVYPPGTPSEQEETIRYYDLSKNVEKEDLTYRDALDKNYQVVVKANKPDGTVKEIKVGTTGGDKIEIKCATSDEASMKARAETELKRRSFSGLEGSITTWLIPNCNPGDSATIRDEDYPYKDGTYFVNSVTTEFSSSGGSRKVELGWKLS